MIDFTELSRKGIAAVAALLLTAISVGAAVGPARAIETGPSYAAAIGEDGGARA